MTDMLTQYQEGRQKMITAEQEIDQHIEQQPYTRDWYRSRFAAQQHRIEGLHAELVDHLQQVRTLRKQVAEKDIELSEIKLALGQLFDKLATIDKLAEKVTEVEARIVKAGDVITKIRADLPRKTSTAA